MSLLERCAVDAVFDKPDPCRGPARVTQVRKSHDPQCRRPARVTERDVDLGLERIARASSYYEHRSVCRAVKGVRFSAEGAARRPANLQGARGAPAGSCAERRPS
jgi:hypothetical protein